MPASPEPQTPERNQSGINAFFGSSSESRTRVSNLTPSPSKPTTTNVAEISSKIRPMQSNKIGHYMDAMSHSQIVSFN